MGISSAWRPVSIPADIFCQIDFLAELFLSKEFAQALTIDAATKPLILLNGARQLGPNAFQLFSKLGMGILELVPFMMHLMQHPLAGL